MHYSYRRMASLISQHSISELYALDIGCKRDHFTIDNFNSRKCFVDSLSVAVMLFWLDNLRGTVGITRRMQLIVKLHRREHLWLACQVLRGYDVIVKRIIVSNPE